MDPRSFDALSRRFATIATRRAVVAAGIAAAIGGTVVETASAANRICRLPDHKCVRDSQCCSGSCTAAGRRSRIRRCTCSASQLRCGNNCIDPLVDARHCGGCDGDCAPLADTCVSGNCMCGDDDPCDPDIADACVAGACMCGDGPACEGGATCDNGVCTIDCRSALISGPASCITIIDRPDTVVYCSAPFTGGICTSSSQCEAGCSSYDATWSSNPALACVCATGMNTGAYQSAGPSGQGLCGIFGLTNEGCQ